VFLRDLCALLSVVSVLSFPEARVSRPLPSACEIVPLKRKSPDQSRGALLYIHQSTRLVIALSSKKCITCKMLKRRTLASIKKPAPLFQTTQNGLKR